MVSKLGKAARGKMLGMPVAAQVTPETTTRARILEIAAALFVEKGYEKTSLREIAERLGFSKAAVYYHFTSKDDILLALHLQLHEVFHDVLDEMSSKSTDPATWAGVVESLVDRLLAHRDLIVLHEINRSAFESMHDRVHHEGDHQDLDVQVRRLLRDRSVPLELRVRFVSAIGGLIYGLLMAGDAFDDVATDQLADILRGAVGDVLRPRKRR